MAYVISTLALESLVGDRRIPQTTKMNGAASEAEKRE